MNFKKEILEPLVIGFKYIGSIVLFAISATAIFAGIVAFTNFVFSLSTLLGAVLTIFLVLGFFVLMGRELRF